MNVPVGPLPGPMRKYQLMIDEIIAEWGIGKKEEFQREGVIAIYHAMDRIYTTITDVMNDAYIEWSIREHFRSLLPHYEPQDL
jgi:hypothetical protein